MYMYKYCMYMFDYTYYNYTEVVPQFITTLRYHNFLSIYGWCKYIYDHVCSCLKAGEDGKFHCQICYKEDETVIATLQELDAVTNVNEDFHRLVSCAISNLANPITMHLIYIVYRVHDRSLYSYVNQLGYRNSKT